MASRRKPATSSNNPSSPISFLSAIFIILESAFIVTFFWQTRLDLGQIWPNIFILPIISDYLKPFLYLSQLLFIACLTVWLVLYRYSIYNNLSLLPLKIRHLSSLPKVTLLTQPLFWLAAAIVLSLISVLVNQPQWWNWFKLANMLGGVVVATYLYYRLKQGAGWSLISLLCLAVVIQQLLIIYQWLFQSSLGLQWLGEWRTTVYTPGVAKVVIGGQEYLRSFGTFAHSNIAGVTLALLWLPGLAVIRHFFNSTRTISNNPSYTYWLYGIWTVLTCLAVLLTFSRLAWLVLALQLIFIALIVRPHLPRSPFYTQHKYLLVTLLGVIVVVGAILVIPRLSSLASYDHLSVDRRVQLNLIALENIKQYPLWGIGPANHIIALYQYGPLYGLGIWRQPVHNIYLLAATELGLLATTAWLMTVLTAIYRLYQTHRSAIKSNHLVSWLILTWFSVAVVGLFDHFWLSIYPASLTIFILTAVTLYCSRSKSVST